MGKSTYQLVITALAFMPVAPPSAGYGQQLGHSAHGTPSATHRRTPLVPHWGAPVRSRNFAGHVYHGRLAWGHGRWHHGKRNGRYGWWWDVGGVWYYYPEPFEGPPNYVSDIDVVDEPTVAQPVAPPPPREPRHAVYYRPRDLTGTQYQTLKECFQARQEAGNVGVCVWK